MRLYRAGEIEGSWLVELVDTQLVNGDAKATLQRPGPQIFGGDADRPQDRRLIAPEGGDLETRETRILQHVLQYRTAVQYINIQYIQ